MTKIAPPAGDALNDYYKSYAKYVEDEDLLAALSKQSLSTLNWLNALPDKIEDHSYQEGKWKLKEVVGHLCDSERIFAYRAMRFARNDKTELPGFDEKSYTPESDYGTRTLKDIIEEWKTIRSATISLFSSMSEQAIDRSGLANGVMVSPRIILFFIIAHERHHLQVMKDRYLTTANAL